MKKQKEEKGDRGKKLMLAAIYRQFFTRHTDTAGIKERKLVCRPQQQQQQR